MTSDNLFEFLPPKFVSSDHHDATTELALGRTHVAGNAQHRVIAPKSQIFLKVPTYYQLHVEFEGDYSSSSPLLLSTRANSTSLDCSRSNWSNSYNRVHLNPLRADQISPHILSATRVFPLFVDIESACSSYRFFSFHLDVPVGKYEELNMNLWVELRRDLLIESIG